jgi:DNA-directed RNA polymerase subunit N (RpoN/RPB10)
MRCHRCGSMMVYERFYGPDEHFSGWRCISCGEIIDQVILENRETRADSQSRGRRRESC